MFRGQHIGVPWSGGVGDTAHGVILAGRSGLFCCGPGRALRPGRPARRGRRDGAGYIRLGAAMPSNCRPVPRAVRAALASCSRPAPPAAAPRPVRPWRNRAGLHHRAGLLPVEVPADQVLQVSGDHVRLPTARRPGHPFREPGHRVEQHPLAGVREQARLEPLHIQFRQPEVSSLPQRRRGVSVRVPNSIGGIAQVLRGHGLGGQARLGWPGRTGGRTADEPAEREPDRVLPRVRDGLRDRPIFSRRLFPWSEAAPR